MKQLLNLIYLILVGGLIFNSCDIKQKSQEKQNGNEIAVFNLNSAKAKIQEKTNRFTEAHITKDTAYLNTIFTKDARVFPPNSEVVTGQKDISQLNFDWVNYGIYEFKEETLFLYGNEDYIIDEGSYYLRYGEENTVDNGKYINVWKNVNGDWKIYSNIWNTNLPAE